MIDIHSHILPGVDDGAQTEQASIEMAKMAVEEGVTKIVASPHHKNRHYDNYKEAIVTHVKVLNELFQENNIPLEVLVGQEVRVYGEILRDFEKGEIQTINDTNYILIEFPFDSVPQYVDQLLYDMQIAGLRPIIVHPERNRELRENKQRMYELVRGGALSQVTAASLLGNFGKDVEQFSFELIEADLTHFIASDAHNTTNRPFHMQEAFAVVDEKFGADTAYLLRENSHLLVENLNIHQLEPRPIKKRRSFFNFFRK